MNLLRFAIVILLLSLTSTIYAGNPPQTTQRVRNKALFKAVANFDESAILAALRNGAEINAEDPEDERGFTPLLKASHDVSEGQEESSHRVVGLLLANGANIDQPAPGGITALTRAACDNDFETVKILMEKGADPNASSSSALECAKHYANADMISLLVAHKATHEVKSVYPELLEAARAGDERKCRLLIKNGADITVHDPDGYTLLMYVAAHRWETFLPFFKKLPKKAINAISRKGWTALMFAQDRHAEPIVKWLKENGGVMYKSPIDRSLDTEKKSVCDALGYMPALPSIIELTKQGADLKEICFGDRTALIEAVRAGHKPLVEYMLEKGLDINFQSKAGGSALDFSRSFPEIKDILLKAGARDVQPEAKANSPIKYGYLRPGSIGEFVIPIINSADAKATLQNPHIVFENKPWWINIGKNLSCDSIPPGGSCEVVFEYTIAQNAPSGTFELDFKIAFSNPNVFPPYLKPTENRRYIIDVTPPVLEMVQPKWLDYPASTTKMSGNTAKYIVRGPEVSFNIYDVGSGIAALSIFTLSNDDLNSQTILSTYTFEERKSTVSYRQRFEEGLYSIDPHDHLLYGISENFYVDYTPVVTISSYTTVKTSKGRYLDSFYLKAKAHWGIETVKLLPATLLMTNPADTSGFDSATAIREYKANGADYATFTFQNVPAGEYVLYAKNSIGSLSASPTYIKTTTNKRKGLPKHKVLYSNSKIERTVKISTGAIAVVKPAASLDNKPEEKVLSVGELGQMCGSTEDLLTLISCLENENSWLKQVALEKIAKIGLPAAEKTIPYLRKLIKEKDVWVKKYAVAALGKMGENATAAVPELIDIIKGKGDTELVESSEKILGAIGPAAKDAIPVLLEELNGKYDNYQTYAANALAGIGIPAIPGLINTLKSTKRSTRMLAVKALGDIGPPANKATPALNEFLHDAEMLYYKQAVESALKKINP